MNTNMIGFVFQNSLTGLLMEASALDSRVQRMGYGYTVMTLAFDALE